MFLFKKRKSCNLIIEYESFLLLRGQERKGAGKKYRHLVNPPLVAENINENNFNLERCCNVPGLKLDKLYKFPNRKFKGVWWMP